MSQSIGDTIRQVIEIERKAEAVVAQSEKDAADLLASAREESRRIVEAARRNAVAEAEQLVRDGQAQAEAERDRQIAEAIVAEESALAGRQSALSPAAEAIARAVSGT